MSWYHPSFPTIPIPDWIRSEFTNIPRLLDETDAAAHPRFARRAYDVVTGDPVHPYIWVTVEEPLRKHMWARHGVYLDYEGCPGDVDETIEVIYTDDQRMALGGYLMAILFAAQFRCTPPPVMQAGKPLGLGARSGPLYAPDGTPRPGIPHFPVGQVEYHIRPGSWPDWMPGAGPGGGAAQSPSSPFDPADVEIINRHRARIGGEPIDLGAGWTPREIAEMAENIRTKGRTHNPKLKRRLMR